MAAYEFHCESLACEKDSGLIGECRLAMARALITEAEASLVAALTATPKKSKVELQKAASAHEKKLSTVGGFKAFQPALRDRCEKALAFD